MNWNTVLDLTIEFGYNAATSLMSYVVGTNVLAMPKPAAYLVAGLVGFVGMANHWRALRKASPVLLLALALGVTGCASVEKARADIAAFTEADIDQAIAMASKATDAEAPYRARCYVTLKKYAAGMAAPSGVTLPKGAVSAFELAAEVDQHARGGVGLPQDLRADCAVILISATEFAARMGLKFAPIPGGGAVGGLLK